MIEALDHVAIAVADLDAAASDYERLLGREADRQGEAGGARRAWFHLSNMSLELIAPAGPGPAGDRVRSRLDAAGEGTWIVAFAVGDLASARRTLERRGLPGMVVEGAQGEAYLGDVEASYGVQLAFRERRDGPPAASPVIGAANAAFAGLDHVVVGTPNPDRALALYGARLGLDLRLDRTNPAWGARQLFFRCGDLVVEIGHGLKAGVSDAPDRLGGLAWRVTDPAAVHERLEAAGFNVSELRAGRKPGTEVFTVRDRTCGVPTLVLSATPAGED